MTAIVIMIFGVLLIMLFETMPNTRNFVYNYLGMEEEQEKSTVSDGKKNWDLLSYWDNKKLDILHNSLVEFSENVFLLTKGTLKINIVSPGESFLGRPLKPDDIRELVKDDKSGAEMGHSASYYWKTPASSIFTTVPFGLDAIGMYSWLYHGDGLQLWRDMYEKDGLYPIPMGSTGIQMGGWFHHKVQKTEDWKDQKIRMPGIGGKVLETLGARNVSVLPTELNKKLNDGEITAAEWVGPYDDQKLSLHLGQEGKRYYHFPGWHEPGTTFELIINKKSWDSLTEQEKLAINISAKAVHLDMYSRYQVKNSDALKELYDKNISFMEFNEEILNDLSEATQKYLEENQEDDFLSVYENYKNFQSKYTAWEKLSSHAYKSGATDFTNIKSITNEISRNTDTVKFEKEDLSISKCELNIGKEKVYFDSGKETLDSNGKKAIEILAKILRKYPDLKIEIIGYTDSSGNARDNEILSKKRALLVRDIFLDNNHEKSNLIVKGEGVSTLAETQAENRQVMIKVSGCIPPQF